MEKDIVDDKTANRADKEDEDEESSGYLTVPSKTRSGKCANQIKCQRRSALVSLTTGRLSKPPARDVEDYRSKVRKARELEEEEQRAKREDIVESQVSH